MVEGNLVFDAHRVLIADGEPQVRRNVATALEEMGLATFEVERGQEVLDVIASVEMHAFVLDSQLPDFGGIETVRIIRTFQEVPPFLLLAQDVTQELQVAALEIEATSILPKPVDLDILSDIVRTILMRWWP